MIDFNIPVQSISFSIFSNNTIHVKDSHEYDNSKEYAAFEWFENHDKKIVVFNSYKLVNKEPWHTEELFDGHFTYYKIVVPKQDETLNGNLGWIELENEILLQIKDGDKWTDISLQDAFKNIHETIKDQSNESYCYPGAEMFLIGIHKKCLTELQTMYINTVLQGACKDSVENKRNFLHAAIEVIKYLLLDSDYVGAQRILDRLTEHGCEFCKDTRNIKKDCCCGETY